MTRNARCSRQTRETDIELYLELLERGCAGSFKGETGIGFLDHMMAAVCVHAGINITLDMTGDLEVDCHHSAEDLGIVFGAAFAQAVGDKSTVKRYGSACIPMDEALSRAVLDISSRPFLVFNASFKADRIGTLDTQMIKEFFRAFAFNAGITLHIENLYGENDHHIAESIFKAFARALSEAAAPHAGDILSSKGAL